MQSIYNLILFITRKWNRLKTVAWYSFLFKKMGKYCMIIDPLVITPDCVVVGKNVFIGWRARIEGVKKYQSKEFRPQIVLNDGVSIQQNLHLTCAKLIEIGKNTAIAANVTITDIHHPYKDINIPIEFQDIEILPVSIGENCKIYNNAVIMQGTRLGRHCTVGANSVVSGKFDDYCVIAGSPARVLKRYSFEKQMWLKTDAKGNFIEL